MPDEEGCFPKQLLNANGLNRSCLSFILYRSASGLIHTVCLTKVPFQGRRPFVSRPRAKFGGGRCHSKVADVLLPVDVVPDLERAVLAGAGDDSIFLCGLLLMWLAGLHFSDVRRLDSASISSSEGCCHGRCWITKSRRAGMAWGSLERGCLSANWGLQLMEEVRRIRAESPKQDILLAFRGKPMSCSVALPRFRKALVVYEWPEDCGQYFPVRHSFLDGYFVDLG